MYLICVEDCICHDELLNWQLLDNLLKSLIFAKPMETININIPSSHFFKLFHMFFCRVARANKIIIQNNIFIFNIIADIVPIIEEPKLTLEPKQFKAIFQPSNISNIILSDRGANNDRIFQFCPY